MSPLRMTITRSVQAEQWKEGVLRPDGTFDCLPEAHWSADRSLIYFTYAELRPRHWMGVERLTVPEKLGEACGPLDGGVHYVPKEDAPYWRKLLPFSFWSVKSEASVKRDHRPLFVDGIDADLVALFHDYASAEEWPNPIPRRIEFREMSGQYGRGYRPIYMKPNDWLLREVVPDGHDNLGTKEVIRVVSDEEFQRMRAIGAPAE